MRQSQLTGRARLRGLRDETKAAGEEIDHERHRFEEINGSRPVIVAAHQLFPTPPPIADRLIKLAEIQTGDRVLEPSAGTGNLLAALQRGGTPCSVVAVEINRQLADVLRKRWPVVCGDFLAAGPELGQFDRVVMNPPFTRASDVKHIRHALQFVKPGGRLVSLCMAGNSQRGALSDADEWIDLPPKSFRSEGTAVDAAIVIFEA